MKTAIKIGGGFLLGMTAGLTSAVVILRHLFAAEEENDDSFGIIAENYYWN